MVSKIDLNLEVIKTTKNPLATIWVKNIITKIQRNYNDIFFHNWNHAENVVSDLQKLTKPKTIYYREYSYKEQVSKNKLALFLAWFWHDVLHTWIPSDTDEEKSAYFTQEIIDETNLFSNEFSENVKELILWTKFKLRWDLKNYDDSLKNDRMLLADADIAHLWKFYKTWVENSFKLFLEQRWTIDNLSDDEIFEHFKKEPWFFEYLKSISWKTNSPFLTNSADEIFTEFDDNEKYLSKDLKAKNPEFLKYSRELLEK